MHKTYAFPAALVSPWPLALALPRATHIIQLSFHFYAQHIHIYIYIYIHMYIHVCIMYIYIYVYIYIHIYIYIERERHVYTYIYIYIYVFIYLYKYAHITIYYIIVISWRLLPGHREAPRTSRWDEDMPVHARSNGRALSVGIMCVCTYVYIYK